MFKFVYDILENFITLISLQTHFVPKLGDLKYVQNWIGRVSIAMSRLAGGSFRFSYFIHRFTVPVACVTRSLVICIVLFKIRRLFFTEKTVYIFVNNLVVIRYSYYFFLEMCWRISKRYRKSLALALVFSVGDIGCRRVFGNQ